MSEPIIAFRNVSYTPPAALAPVLSDLELEVARGEILVLLGESGCGKTTTLRLANALLLPTQGEVLVEGQPTRGADSIALRRRIGYVIQEGGLFPHWSVARNVATPLLLGPQAHDKAPAPQGEPSVQQSVQQSIQARVEEVLGLVGLAASEFAHRSPALLSGGQRQRVGVARALVAKPPILLMDEPFGALDPITRHALQLEFQALVRALGTTVVLVTHDVREALLLADRIALLRAGRLEMLGTPRQFLDSSNDYARAYRDTMGPPLDPTQASPTQAKGSA